MARVLVFAAIAAVVLAVFAVVDCALTERGRVRALPRSAWILIALLLPVVGPLLWLIVGRVSARSQPVRRVIGPDDDPTFLKSRGPVRPVQPGGTAAFVAPLPHPRHIDDDLHHVVSARIDRHPYTG